MINIEYMACNGVPGHRADKNHNSNNYGGGFGGIAFFGIQQSRRLYKPN